ncbi:N-acyl homoserine lactonase family protein [Conexibacter sp. SYSU D00693]|uniref:N-acyl homoserine lactonase family protein n=1 Tax=Conexibacter sp. SYSU D00693 TaxID=2812560 RepID=UPI00196AE11B|nr:N-acyl homoserine lactonase family protein [Conexibacter sp. SYSU D00693]
MKVHALTTGTVRLKDAFLHARSGWRRQPALFAPGEWSAPHPIHCWAVEHDGRVVLVDTGETRAGSDLPFVRFEVGEDDELPAALARAGLDAAAVDEIVLTHLHGDHMDGLVHLRGRPVHVHAPELAFARSPRGRVQSRLFKQPLPDGVDWQPLELDGGPFGAFAASRPLTPDGRIVVVATPGHTDGHVSVVCVDDDGRHLLLAGDTTDTLDQLHARRPDAVSPKPGVQVATIDRILAHAREHPTVYLPAHDPASAERLAAATTV